ncbi:HAMP domain-containing protein [Massilia horti]|uniref:HAMP domain-containing protein n=2 Tax=Massilia horti TaxID=2562153 RepID=A0A4Y9TA29_9BURK|nr:HAMP domain-containing protein [Massilia horti]
MVTIILFLLTAASHTFSRMAAASESNRHTLEVLLEVNHIATSVLQVQASARGFLLTGDEGLIASIESEHTKTHQHLTRAIALTAHNPSQQERMRQLEPIIGQWIEQVINPQIAHRRAEARAYTPDTKSVFTGTRMVESLRRQLSEIEAEEGRQMATRSANAASLENRMVMLLWVGGALTVMLALAVALRLKRAIAGPLGNLTDAARRLAAGEQSARAEIRSRDELGEVAFEFNRMAQAIQDSLVNETARTNELRAKVDALLEVVSKAAMGDLTGAVTIRGNDAIGRLGEGLDAMFGNLRDLLNNVQKAGIQVTTSATQIAASARQQEATGIEQAQTSVEILSTTREISANTSQLLRTMEEATTVADSTTAATAEAQDNLKRMDLTMQHMVSATDSISAKLAALSEKASNINSVLTTITKVADQTNILSLNAAIEAEKAGEAGRGFSVVATEIRRLADQTSVSTWDIEQMLKEMQSAVAASVMGMDKFSEEIRRGVGEARQLAEQLNSVMDQVRQLTPRFDSLLQGMQSQAVGASQITATMMQLSDASQETVDSLKATSEAVQQLKYAADELQSSVAPFSVST